MNVHRYLYTIVNIIINMRRNKKDVEKRGRKYPEGATKRNILLIALKYIDGVEEPSLVAEIQDKLKIKDIKGIKGHLADLSIGRKIAGREKGKTMKEGKHYLTKIEQKGKANIWSPTPHFDIFKNMVLEEFLSDADIAFPFMQTKYTQKMIKEHVFDLIVRDFSIDLSKEGNIEDLIKKILTKSPSVLKYVLTGRPKEEIEEKKSLFGNFLFGRSRGNGIDTLAFFSILLYADIAKYSDLAQTTEDIRRGIDSIMLNLFHEKARKINEEFIESLKRD